MKEGDIIVPHGANWFGVFKVQKIEETAEKPIAKVIIKMPDHREYRECYVSDDGQLESLPGSWNSSSCENMQLCSSRGTPCWTPSTLRFTLERPHSTCWKKQ